MKKRLLPVSLLVIAALLMQMLPAPIFVGWAVADDSASNNQATASSPIESPAIPPVGPSAQALQSKFTKPGLLAPPKPMGKNPPVFPFGESLPFTDVPTGRLLLPAAADSFWRGQAQIGAEIDKLPADQEIALKIDNVTVKTWPAPPYHFEMDTATYSDGPHLITLTSKQGKLDVNIDQQYVRFDNRPPRVDRVRVDGVAAPGENVPIQARVTDGVSGVARVYVDTADAKIEMQPQPDGIYTATMPYLQESISYQIEAVDYVGNHTMWPAEGQSQWQGAGLPVPSSLDGLVDDHGAIELMWRPVTLPAHAHYAIFRAQPDREPVQIATTAEAQFTDISVRPGFRYTYHISVQLETGWTGLPGPDLTLATSQQQEQGQVQQSAHRAPTPKVRSGLTRADVASALSQPPRPTPVGGSLGQNTVWTLTGSPYLITSDLTIPSGMTLTVKPGVIVKFAPGTSLRVEGRLYAVGTSDQPILFTSSRDDTVGGDTNQDAATTQPLAGDWSNIQIATNGSANLQQVRVLYGGGENAAITGLGGRIHADHVTVQFSGGRGIQASLGDVVNSTIEDYNSVGVYIANGSPRINGNTIRGGNYGVYIASGTPVVSANNITGAAVAGIYLAGFAGKVGGQLIGNTISNTALPVDICLEEGNEGLARLQARDNAFSSVQYAGYGLSGIFDGRSSLQALDHPYIAAGVTVAAGAKLTVASGVVFKMKDGDFTNQGALTLNGTASAPIIFTSFRDDSIGGDTNGDADSTSPAPGDWGSIVLLAGTVVANNVQFSYGGARSAQIDHRGGTARLSAVTLQRVADTAVQVIDGATLDKAKIAEVVTGVRVLGGAPQISNSDISARVDGIDIESSSPRILNNTIHGGSHGIYVGVTDALSAMEVRGNHLLGAADAGLYLHVHDQNLAGLNLTGNEIAQGNFAVQIVFDGSGAPGATGFGANRITHNVIHDNQHDSYDLSGVLTASSAFYPLEVPYTVGPSGEYPTLDVESLVTFGPGANVAFRTPEGTAALSVGLLGVLSFQGTSTKAIHLNGAPGRVNSQGKVVLDHTIANDVSIDSTVSSKENGVRVTNSSFLSGSVTITEPWMGVKVACDVLFSGTSFVGNQELVIGLTGCKNQIEIDNVKVDGSPEWAIASSSPLSVKNSEISSKGFGIAATGEDLKVENVTFNGVGEEGYGIACATAPWGTVVVSNSVMEGERVGFSGAGETFILQHTRITGNGQEYGMGVSIAGNNVEIADSLVEGNSTGIRIAGNSIAVLNTTVRRNEIGIRIGVQEALLSNNDITGNTAGLIGAGGIDARNNWWGAESGPAPYGTGDSVEGNVRVRPWLGEEYIDAQQFGNAQWTAHAGGTNLGNGDWSHADTDLSIDGGKGFSIRITRTYHSLAQTDASLGHNWTFNYDMNVKQDSTHQLATVTYGSGQKARFTINPDGTYTAPAWETSRLQRVSSGWTLTTKDHSTYRFDSKGRITSAVDRNGNTLRFQYGSDGKLATIIDASGRKVTILRDGNGRITQITDPANRTVYYAYDGAGNLTAVTDVMGNQTTYTYDSDHLLTSITGPDHVVQTRVEYDGNSQVIAVYDALSNKTAYSYDVTNHINRVKDPRGYTTTYTYDADWRLLSVTDPLQQTTTRLYDSNNNIISVQDKASSTTTYTYDSHNNLTSETDPLGNVTTYAYDARDNLVSVTTSLGTTTYTYDAHDNRVSQTNALQHTTTYTYNSAGLITSISDAPDFTTSITYDAKGYPIQMIDPEKNKTVRVYDSLGRITSRTDARKYATTYTYDNAGHLLTITDPLQNVTTYTYDVYGRRTSVTDPMGHTTRTAYDAVGHVIHTMDANEKVKTFEYDKAGNQTAVTDELNHSTYYDYDGRNQLIDVIDPEQNVTLYDYDANGNRVYKEDPLGNVTIYGYDLLNRLTNILLPGDTNAQITRTYDALGHMLTEEDPSGAMTTWKYDALGDLIHETDADGVSLSRSYDEMGRLISQTDANGTSTFMLDKLGLVLQQTDALGHTTTYQYDANGNRTRVTDPNGSITVFEYDANNRLTRATDPLGNSTTTAYDAAGNKISVTLPNQGLISELTWQYSYDKRGLLTGVTAPDQVTTAYAYDDAGRLISQTNGNSETTQYGYDALGREISVTDPLQQVQRTTYDAAGNPITVTDRNGVDTHYEYDAQQRLTTVQAGNLPAITFTYDMAGRRESMTDSTGTTHYTYTPAGRLKEKALPDGKSISYEYDKQGRLVRTTDFAGVVVNRTYDDAGRLIGVDSANGGGVQYGYDAGGRRISTTYPGGVVVTYGYDKANHVLDVTASRGDQTPLQAFHYTYDVLGNVTSRKDATGLTSFAYDPQGRLDSYMQPDGTNIRYTYDGAGNRTVETQMDPDHVVTTRQYGYDAADRLVTLTDGKGATTFTYDANGNMLNDEAHAYTYNALNQLVAVSGSDSAMYGYNGDGQRVAAALYGETTQFYWDGDQISLETSDTGVVKARNVYGLERFLREIGPAAQGYDPAGQNQGYYLPDAHGDVRGIADATGNLVATYDFDPWGQVMGKTGNFDNPYRYAGEYQDRGTGTYYLRARSYAPQFGRFLTQDTYKGNSRQPGTQNLYAYANGNPVNMIDPTGHSAQEIQPPTCIGSEIQCGTDWLEAMLAVQRDPEHGVPAAEMACAMGAPSFYCKAALDIARLNGIKTPDWMNNLPYASIEDADNAWEAMQQSAFLTANSHQMMLALNPGEAAAVEVELAGEAEGSPRVLKPMGGGQDYEPGTSSVVGLLRVGSANKLDEYHAFPEMVDNYAGWAAQFTIKNGDGTIVRLFQLEGAYLGDEGIFEWIVNANNEVSHRVFIPNAKITGKPNQW